MFCICQKTKGEKGLGFIPEKQKDWKISFVGHLFSLPISKKPTMEFESVTDWKIIMPIIWPNDNYVNI